MLGPLAFTVKKKSVAIATRLKEFIFLPPVTFYIIYVYLREDLRIKLIRETGIASKKHSPPTTKKGSLYPPAWNNVTT